MVTCLVLGAPSEALSEIQVLELQVLKLQAECKIACCHPLTFHERVCYAGFQSKSTASASASMPAAAPYAASPLLNSTSNLSLKAYNF